MIYFNNAGTSHVKAPGVARRVLEIIEGGFISAGRGSYAGSWETGRMVLETRERLAAVFGLADSRGVIFTSGATQSLNMLLKGLLKPGDTAVTTAMDHNAVLRPLRQLERQGVHVKIVRCDRKGLLDFEDMETHIKNGARAVVMTHASNVCGAVYPIGDVGKVCREHGTALIADTAQTAGLLPIDMERDGIGALAFTGHKGLLAIQGIGGFLIKPELARQMEPLLAGGTGGNSESLEMPLHLPDRFEAGTPNLPGIAALSAALEYKTDVRSIENLRQRFVEGVRDITDICLIGPEETVPGCTIAALDFPGRDNAEVADALAKRGGIVTRSGLHCAPLAHKALGTFPQGAVRFSFGYANTEDEVDICVTALASLRPGLR
jgi:cysteine desulfurase family protein